MIFTHALIFLNKNIWILTDILQIVSFNVSLIRAKVIVQIA